MTSAQAGPPGSGENPPFILDDQKFARLERELRRVPGVRSARVAGVDAPTEIHIVASLARSPKQLVRDVQSLASAGFGMPIDHRIVSVVQLEEEPPPEAAPAQLQPPEPAPHARPVLERVVVVTRAGMSWIKVVFRWPSGEVTEAVSTAEASREARARASVATVLRALEPALRPRDARIEIEHVILHHVGNLESVLVRGSFTVGGVVTQLSGSAIVHDDVSTAAVHAVLQAVNRKLA